MGQLLPSLKNGRLPVGQDEMHGGCWRLVVSTKHWTCIPDLFGKSYVQYQHHNEYAGGTAESWAPMGFRGAPEIITGNRTIFEYVSLHVIVHAHCLLISLSRVEEVSSKSQSDPVVHFPRTWQQHRWHVKIREGTAQRYGIMVQNSVCGGGNMKHMVQ
jgi:hypothetical protein